MRACRAVARGRTARPRRAGRRRRPGRLRLRLLAGRRRLGRGGGREEALPPGEDLRRRAHPAGRPPAGRHGPGGRPGRRPPVPGLRACGFGQIARAALAGAPRLPRLRLHHHPPRPRRPGRRAGRQGRGRRLAGHRGGRAPGSTPGGRRPGPGALPACAGAVVRGPRTPARPGRSGPATWWWPTAPTPGSAGRSGTRRDRQLPAGHGAARATTARRATTTLHRVAPRHPRRRRRRGPRLRLDLPPGRRPGQRRRRPALDRPALEGRQHHPAHGGLRALGARALGALAGDLPAGRRPAASCPWDWRSAPAPAPNTLVVGDAGGSINPFNGEGIAYGYETGRLAAAFVGEALLGGRRRRPSSPTSGSSRRLRRLLPGGPGLRPPHQQPARPCGCAWPSACARERSWPSCCGSWPTSCAPTRSGPAEVGYRGARLGGPPDRRPWLTAGAARRRVARPLVASGPAGRARLGGSGRRPTPCPARRHLGRGLPGGLHRRGQGRSSWARPGKSTS